MIVDPTNLLWYAREYSFRSCNVHCGSAKCCLTAKKKSRRSLKNTFSFKYQMSENKKYWPITIYMEGFYLTLQNFIISYIMLFFAELFIFSITDI